MPIEKKLVENITSLRKQLDQQIVENNYSLLTKETEQLSEKINNLVLVYHAIQLQKNKH